jgi:hypothetical protein
MRNEAAIRRFVLDYLRHGPAPVDDLFRDARAQFAYTREAILDAIEALGVVAKKRPVDGRMLFVFPPENGHAIWWSRRAPAHRFTGAAHGGGNAA